MFEEDFEIEELPQPNYKGYRTHTAALRKKSWGTIEDRIIKVINLMKDLDIDLPLLLDGLSWGTPECRINRRIVHARTALLNSRELPIILNRWWKPSRPAGSTNVRPRGAKAVMEDVSKACMKEVVRREMVALSKLVETKCKTVTSADVTAVHIDELAVEMQAKAPTLWSLLDTVACSEEQRKRNKKKRPEKVRVLFQKVIVINN